MRRVLHTGIRCTSRLNPPLRCWRRYGGLVLVRTRGTLAESIIISWQNSSVSAMCWQERSVSLQTGLAWAIVLQVQVAPRDFIFIHLLVYYLLMWTTHRRKAAAAALSVAHFRRSLGACLRFRSCTARSIKLRTGLLRRHMRPQST